MADQKTKAIADARAEATRQIFSDPTLKVNVELISRIHSEKRSEIADHLEAARARQALTAGAASVVSAARSSACAAGCSRLTIRQSGKTPRRAATSMRRRRIRCCEIAAAVVGIAVVARR